jgi:integrase/recombinase XerD
MTREKQLAAQFLEEEASTGRSPRGIATLKYLLPHLFAYMEERGIATCELGIKEAQGFQGWLLEKKSRKGKPYAKSSVLTVIISALTFCEFLKREGIICTNPFKEIRRIKRPKKLPANLPKEKEMNLFLEELTQYDNQPNLKQKITMYKVHVMAELMYSTGLRVSEVAGLRVEDIDFKRGIATVREGKGGNDRIAWLNEYAKEVLMLYVHRMRPLVFNKYHEKMKDYLFGTNWRTLTTVLNMVLKRESCRILGKELKSHDFRRALGYHLLRAGCSIRHIQSILGHEDIKSTEAYTKVDKEDLKKVFDQYHPRTLKKIK